MRLTPAVLVFGVVGALAAGCAGAQEDSGADAGLPNTSFDAGDSEPADAGPCDVVDKTACDDGKKCTFVNSKFDTGCRTAGAFGENAPCTKDSECDVGLLCARDDTGAQKCQALCHKDTDCPKETERCAIEISGYAGGPVICKDYPTCEPLTQNCAKSTDGCYPMDAAGNCSCMQAGTKRVGESCTYANDCVKGAVCGGNVCSKMCDRHVKPPLCPAGQQCRPVTGTTKFGVCAP